jgi:hypothetical protein
MAVLSGCFSIELQNPSPQESATRSSSVALTVTGASISGDVLTLSGTNLEAVTGITLTGPSVSATFVPTSQSSTQLVATALANLTLALGVAYELVVSSAKASTMTTITVTLGDGSVTPAKLDRTYVQVGANGRVGIGTASPADVLDVAGHIVLSGTGSRLRREVDNSSIAVLGGTAKANGAYFQASGDLHPNLPGRAEIITKGTGDLIIYNSPFGEMSQTPLVTVKSTGRVGIGTTDAQAQLHVVGDAGARFERAGGFQLLLNDTANGTDIQNVSFQRGGVTKSTIFNNASNQLTFQTDSADIRFKSSAADERMRIQADGRVGIGTPTPLTLFHVAGSTPSVRFENSAAAANHRIFDIKYEGDGLAFRHRNDAGGKVTDSLSLMWIENGANPAVRVGIGDDMFPTSAANTLHVTTMDTATGAVTDVVRVAHDTTQTTGGGLAQAGKGAALLFAVEMDGTSNRAGGSGDEAGRIAAVATNATPGAQATALTFSTRTGGGALTERLRISDQGSVQVPTAGEGLVVKSPDGSTCRKIGIDNTGAIVATAVTCP